MVKKPPKEKSPCFCLSEIVLDSVCEIKNKGNKYYSQTYLEECQYQEKKSSKKNKYIKGKTATKLIKLMMSLPNKSSSFQKKLLIVILVCYDNISIKCRCAVINRVES